jgi:hypothetical protein
METRVDDIKAELKDYEDDDDDLLEEEWHYVRDLHRQLAKTK